MKFVATALTILNLIQSVISWDCDNVISRQSIYKMSDEDRNRYFDAVKAINSGPKPTEWDKFARIHVEYFWQIHDKPMFFPWHRVYLANLERLLRTKDPKVRIPFWDWTQYYDNRSNDPIWQWFGREGDSEKQYCVKHGVFSDFMVYYRPDMNESPSERCLTRNSNIENTFGCDSTDFTANGIDQRDNESFLKNITRYHDSVHDKIGKDFSDLISSNDPLFFSHHAFVDAAWFLRQMRHPDLTESYSGNLNDNIPYFNIPVSESIDPTNLCYSYREDNYPWSNEQSDRPMEFPIYIPKPTKDTRFEPFHPIYMKSPKGQSNTETVNDHARKYVFKNITSPINKDTINMNGSGCTLTPIPDILSIEFINMMRYDQVEIRESERKQALFIENLNQKCLG
jgi:hypothetical protein